MIVIGCIMFYLNYLSVVFSYLLAPDIGSKITGIVYLFLIYVIPITLVIFFIGIKKRCPYCKKLFALKKTGKEVVDTEKRNMRVQNDVYNNNNDVIGYSDQWVQGKRYYYHKNYRCKHCGKTTFKEYSKDSIN